MLIQVTLDACSVLSKAVLVLSFAWVFSGHEVMRPFHLAARFLHQCNKVQWLSLGLPVPGISACSLLQVHITEIAIRLDFKLDESYTPNRLSIRAGTSFHDLREIKIVTVHEVTGWVMIPLEPPDHP